jgi:hypothetical protein
MKALTLALCILALLGSAASGYFWYEVGNQKKELQGQLSIANASLERTRSDLGTTTAELETKKTQLAESDAAHGSTKRKLTAAEASNVQAARELDTLKRGLAEKEAAEKRLSADLDTLRRDLVQARLAATGATPEEVEAYKQKISALEAQVSQLLTNPAAGGSAPGVVVTGSDGKLVRISERASAAKIVRVGPKNAFVVLELGSSDGISVGNKFNLTRDGKTIAEGVISEVTATNAIAQVVPASIKSALQAGDVATYAN